MLTQEQEAVEAFLDRDTERLQHPLVQREPAGDAGEVRERADGGFLVWDGSSVARGVERQEGRLRCACGAKRACRHAKAVEGYLAGDRRTCPQCWGWGELALPRAALRAGELPKPCLACLGRGFVSVPKREALDRVRLQKSEQQRASGGC